MASSAPAMLPHRDGAECAEALGPSRDELGRIVVAAPRQLLRARPADEADAGLRQRRERDLDAVRVHQLERELRRPFRVSADGGAAPRRVDRLAVERRDEVEVQLYPARRCHRSLPHVLRSRCIMSDACAEATSERQRRHPRVEFCQRPCLYAPRHVGRKNPCPGWTPTASASTSSLPARDHRSCSCTRWAARSPAGTAFSRLCAHSSARSATTSAARACPKRCANRSPPNSWSRISRRCCKPARCPPRTTSSPSPPRPCRR